MLTTTRLHLLRARRVVGSKLPAAARPPLCSSGLTFGRASVGETIASTRHFVASATRREDDRRPREDVDGDVIPAEELTSVGSHEQQHEHAVISTFDLFSIGGMFAIRVTIPKARIGCLIVGV